MPHIHDQRTDITLLQRSLEDVIEWNAVAHRSGLAVPLITMIENQRKYATEEIIETINAINDCDETETIDGIADVFVTVSYLAYLLDPSIAFVSESRNESFFPSFDEQPQQTIEVDTSQMTQPGMDFVMLGTLLSIVCNPAHGAEDLLKGLILAIEAVCVGNSTPCTFDAAVQRVMKSNWSKFPHVYDITNPDQEARWIEEAHQVSNVRPVMAGERYVFRDQYGHGKIRKPACYTKPDFTEAESA